MLYGGTEVNNTIVDWLQKRENSDENDMRIVYVSCANSYSQGISRYDSDYDIHVVMYNPTRELCTEGTIRRSEKHSVHSDIIELGTHNRAHIELIEWNDVDIFSSLVLPQKEQRRVSPTVYYILYSTLYNKYTYDPLGVIPYILSQASLICDLNIIMKYFMKRAESRTKDEKAVSLKSYMSRLHCYLSILWIYKFNSFPPIDIKLLLKQIDKNESDIIYEYYLKYKDKPCDNVREDLADILNKYMYKAADAYSSAYSYMPVATESEQINAYKNIIDFLNLAMRK